MSIHNQKITQPIPSSLNPQPHPIYPHLHPHQQHQTHEAQMLKLKLKQWSNRRTPNTDEVVSVCFAVQDLVIKKNIKNTRKCISNKQQQSQNGQNSDTNDLNNDSPFHIKNHLIKNTKNNQKPLKKQQTKAKFRESTNSHLRKEKQFKETMWELAIEQRFFYDNAKYRYQQSTLVDNILAAAQTSNKLEQYAVQTIEVGEEPAFSRSRDANQFERAINEKISLLFPRTSNFSADFF